MTWKKIIPGLALLIAIGVALGFFWPFGHRAQTLTLPGVVETQEIHLGSKIGGRVDRVDTIEGATEEAGKGLVYFEVPELKAQRLQAQARLEAAEAFGLSDPLATARRHCHLGAGSGAARVRESGHGG